MMSKDIRVERDLTCIVEPLKLSDALKLPGVQEEELRISEAIERAKKDLRKK